jgi:hypothetical protein
MLSFNLLGRLGRLGMRWSRLFGQFGGEVKLIPGFDYAAIWSVFAGWASPASERISFAP